MFQSNATYDRTATYDPFGMVLCGIFMCCLLILFVVMHKSLLVAALSSDQESVQEGSTTREE